LSYTLNDIMTDSYLHHWEYAVSRRVVGEKEFDMDSVDSCTELIPFMVLWVSENSSRLNLIKASI